MNKKALQLDLFHSRSLNITYEIKRTLRISLSSTHLSRHQVADEMNKIASLEGMRKSISKAALDSWTKDSDPDRLPSLPWLVILCKVLKDISPITVMLHPFGCEVVDGREKFFLRWAEAELAKKEAAKKAKLALSQIEGF